MRDYANIVVLGALCVLGCSNAETPASTQTGAMTGAGMTASAAPAAMSGAGTPATSTASAGKPATTPAATGGSAAPATTASAGAAAPTMSASAGSGAAGSATASAGSSASGAAGSSAAAGSGASSGGAMDPTFKNVYTTVLLNQCPSCHMMGGVIGSPDLSSMDTAYSSLVDKDATTAMTGVCGGKGKLVTPGDCDKSLLYNKLSQATPICGRRMPLSSMVIPQSGLDLLCAWIKAGAKNN